MLGFPLNLLLFSVKWLEMPRRKILVGQGWVRGVMMATVVDDVDSWNPRSWFAFHSNSEIGQLDGENSDQKEKKEREGEG